MYQVVDLVQPEADDPVTGGLKGFQVSSVASGLSSQGYDAVVIDHDVGVILAGEAIETWVVHSPALAVAARARSIRHASVGERDAWILTDRSGNRSLVMQINDRYSLDLRLTDEASDGQLITAAEAISFVDEATWRTRYSVTTSSAG